MKYSEFISLEKYTLKHKLAFLRVERDLLGHNTWRGLFHDADKFLWLYPVALIMGRDKKWVQICHRKNNRHHAECPKERTRSDYIEMIIDWECARFTKADKQLDAYDTMKKFYPQLQDVILPLLREFNLEHRK